jgi:hypothetical protein
MPGKIAINYALPGVLILPEILKIMQTMVDAYNNFDLDQAPVKMCSDQVEGSIVRYQAYDSKADLMEAIIANCPVGLRIIQG